MCSGCWRLYRRFELCSSLPFLARLHVEIVPLLTDTMNFEGE
ncbi:hypothetical protein ARMA_1214 [Ardenticatena maritima]|uniref:Uncharacterized protein n=1 Tax=Ardenticatena maritima TaxID=872965 RepID=A0A0M8K858_9CHLR|nr:hypothetical protein ARMA_1214 [Ardenticatena maritima]